MIPSIAAFTKHVVGGEYCRRAKNFNDVSLPSSVALRHRDVDAAVLYEFCVNALGLRGRDIADAAVDFKRRKRERDVSGDRGQSSQ